MAERYWLVLPNGGRQLIDPGRFDLPSVAERARQIGGRLVLEVAEAPAEAVRFIAARVDQQTYHPPVAAMEPLFRSRFQRIHRCRVGYSLDINERPTVRILGGYYRRRRMVRLYVHDRDTGRRPLEELFDTFLHEIAHHLEYTEPDSFDSILCGRVRGRMHSPLFWRIFGHLKRTWARIQTQPAAVIDLVTRAGGHHEQRSLFDWNDAEEPDRS
jgi:hypothetical protein